MNLSAALLGLAAGGSAPALNIDPRSIDPCAKPGPDEIVVCGSRSGQSRYRLPKLGHEFDAKRFHPESVVPGGRIHVESVTRPDGTRDNRIMITFALPF